MSSQEVLTELRTLPFDEQREILRVLMLSLGSLAPKNIPVEEIRGIAKPSGEPPAMEELRDQPAREQTDTLC